MGRLFHSLGPMYESVLVPCLFFGLVSYPNMSYFPRLADLMHLVCIVCIFVFSPVFLVWIPCKIGIVKMGLDRSISKKAFDGSNSSTFVAYTQESQAALYFPHYMFCPRQGIVQYTPQYKVTSECCFIYMSTCNM